jgi:hypothetical protein
MASSVQMLAQIRDLTGKHIHLGPFEEVFGLAMTDDTITLGVNRAKVEHTFAGDRITKRGRTLYLWNLDARGVWHLMDTTSVYWSTDEMHVTRERRQHDSDWEDMCHRPGTSKTPLDNRERQAQGY